MRTVITSADRLFLDCLVSLFSGNRFQVVSAHTSIRESINVAQRLLADLVVVDLEGSHQSDIQFLLGAHLFGDFRTLLITDSLPEGFQFSVSRSDAGQTLLDTATQLCADIVPRPRAKFLAGNGLHLSNRQYELACLVAKGYTNSQIAESMAIKEQSVKHLCSTVIRKLKCENRVQVALQLSQR